MFDQLKTPEYLHVVDALRVYRRARAELRTLGVLRSERNIPGEFGEWLVARELGLTLSTSSVQAGYDAVDATGHKYQIKARCVPNAQSPTSFDVRDPEHDFDELIGVLLSQDYECLAVIAVTREAFDTHAARNRGSVRLRWTRNLFDASWVKVLYRVAAT
jgi:hypothetical protein